MKKFILISLLATITFTISAHPIKMSTSKLVVNTRDHSYQMTLNLFIDDFEPAIRNIYPQPPLNYANPDETMLASIQDYINKNILVKADENQVTLKIVSIEKIDTNVCQVKLTGMSSQNSPVKIITIKNTILFQSFSKQTNVVHVVIDGASPKILQFYPDDAIQVIKL